MPRYQCRGINGEVLMARYQWRGINEHIRPVDSTLYYITYLTLIGAY